MVRKIWRYLRSPLLLGAIWVILVLVGMDHLLNYAQRAGDPAQPPAEWPMTSSMARAPGKAQLIMVAHPRCPCTRASVEDLSQLMAHCQGSVQAHVLFLVPDGAADRWSVTDLWRSAALIPGVEVVLDRAGHEANRFRVETSGETLLFSPDGRLLFSGGITASRGHAGDNPGSDAILSLLLLKKPAPNTTPVYGCPLFDRHTAAPSDTL